MAPFASFAGVSRTVRWVARCPEDAYRAVPATFATSFDDPCVDKGYSLGPSHTFRPSILEPLDYCHRLPTPGYLCG